MSVPNYLQHDSSSNKSYHINSNPARERAYPEMSDKNQVTQHRLEIGPIHDAEADNAAAAATHALHRRDGSERFLGRQFAVLLEEIVEIVALKDAHRGVGLVAAALARLQQRVHVHAVKVLLSAILAHFCVFDLFSVNKIVQKDYI